MQWSRLWTGGSTISYLNSFEFYNFKFGFPCSLKFLAIAQFFSIPEVFYILCLIFLFFTLLCNFVFCYIWGYTLCVEVEMFNCILYQSDTFYYLQVRVCSLVRADLSKFDIVNLIFVIIGILWPSVFHKNINEIVSTQMRKSYCLFQALSIFSKANYCCYQYWCSGLWKYNGL